jgi:DtxR family Mn-dependent transcriptional regulator
MADDLTLGSLSETMQMYVKSIHAIQSSKGAARVTDIATSLGVRKGSVSVALRSLSERGYVNYAPYDVITLTESGIGVAEELERRYRILRDFFVSVLGIDEATAEDEACNLEHRISAELHDRLIGFVEYYQTCDIPTFRWSPELGVFCVDPDDETG